MPSRLLCLLAALISTTIVSISAVSPAMSAELSPKKSIVVIAHRGAHREVAENTPAAIRHAIELGCDYVEVDVRRTKDGVLVLMHDRSVDRTTNGKGNVKDLTYAEIRELTVGKSEKVPTFDEALKLCRGKIKVYIDHKDAPPAEIVAAVERHQMVDEVFVYSSFEALREFKRLNPKIWIMPPHPGTPEKIAAARRELKAETFDGNIRDWTVEQVTAAHTAGAQVWVDNLGENDNEAGFRKSIEMGVDAIQTDHPRKLIQFLKHHGYR